MVRRTSDNRRSFAVLVGMAVVGLLAVGCKPSYDSVGIADIGVTYSQTNLVASNSGFTPTPLRVDTSLLNAWGLARDAAGDIAIAANHSGMDIFYDDMGAPTLPAIQVPAADSSFPGAPSGQVYNWSDEFMMPGTKEKSRFIISTEDGLICAWASGPNATIIIPPLDSTAVYKGLAMAKHGRKTYLYATNFRDHRVDVFNGEWMRVATFPFVDTTVPAEYSPFGISNVDNKLWVTYAIPKPPDFMDDSAGPGNGLVDIYNPNGTLVRRFYSHGVLNSPWGVTMAPDGFGSQQKVLLVGNFGDGKINAFYNSGALFGALKTTDGDTIIIDGLWALMASPGQSGDKVYYTAGPNQENDGLFGYLKTEFRRSPRMAIR